MLNLALFPYQNPNYIWKNKAKLPNPRLREECHARSVTKGV